MTKTHRRHSMFKKREVVEAYFHVESMRALSEKHDISRTLIPIWIDKYERGEFDDDAIEEELLPPTTQCGRKAINSRTRPRGCGDGYPVAVGRPGHGPRFRHRRACLSGAR